MSETPDGVDHIAVLHLECRRGHYVGRLLIDRGDRFIEFWRADDTSQPEWWVLTDTGVFSQRCPGGCWREVGASRHELVRRVLALADDPRRDEETFVLRDIGGPGR